MLQVFTFTKAHQPRAICASAHCAVVKKNHEIMINIEKNAKPSLRYTSWMPGVRSPHAMNYPPFTPLPLVLAHQHHRSPRQPFSASLSPPQEFSFCDKHHTHSLAMIQTSRRPCVCRFFSSLREYSESCFQIHA